MLTLSPTTSQSCPCTRCRSRNSFTNSVSSTPPLFRSPELNLDRRSHMRSEEVCGVFPLILGTIHVVLHCIRVRPQVATQEHLQGHQPYTAFVNHRLSGDSNGVMNAQGPWVSFLVFPNHKNGRSRVRCSRDTSCTQLGQISKRVSPLSDFNDV